MNSLINSISRSEFCAGACESTLTRVRQCPSQNTDETQLQPQIPILLQLTWQLRQALEITQQRRDENFPKVSVASEASSASQSIERQSDEAQGSRMVCQAALTSERVPFQAAHGGCRRDTLSCTQTSGQIVIQLHRTLQKHYSVVWPQRAREAREFADYSLNGFARSANLAIYSKNI